MSESSYKMRQVPVYYIMKYMKYNLNYIYIYIYVKVYIYIYTCICIVKFLFATAQYYKLQKQLVFIEFLKIKNKLFNIN